MTAPYEIDGATDAPVVTLAHAQLLDRSSWESTVEALRDRYRVLRMDLPGHGENPDPTGDFTIEDVADDIVAVLDEVGVARTHFAGSSFGAMVGFALALDHRERLHSVTFAATQGNLAEESKVRLRANAAKLRQAPDGMASVADTIVGRFMAEGYSDTHPVEFGRVRDVVAASSVEGYIRSSEAIMAMDFDGRLADIETPTFVLAAEHDRATPPARMKLYRDNIAGARMAVVPGAGHFPFIDQPEAFNALLGEFLDSVAS